MCPYAGRDPRLSDPLMMIEPSRLPHAPIESPERIDRFLETIEFDPRDRRLGSTRKSPRNSRPTRCNAHVAAGTALRCRERRRKRRGIAAGCVARYKGEIITERYIRSTIRRSFLSARALLYFISLHVPPLCQLDVGSFLRASYEFSRYLRLLMLHNC